MSFLGKFTFNETALPSGAVEESYNIVQWIFDYNHGQFKDHDNKIIIEDGVENYSDNDVADYMQRQNNAEYIRLLENKKTILADIAEDGHVDKYEGQLEFIGLVQSRIKYLYRTNNRKLPVVPVEKRKTKQDQFLESFDMLYNNPNSTEEAVRSALYNKDYYRNPSALMGYVRKERGLTKEEISQHPAFHFTGRQGRTSN
jgi:hypothetical protein